MDLSQLSSTWASMATHLPDQFLLNLANFKVLDLLTIILKSATDFLTTNVIVFICPYLTSRVYCLLVTALQELYMGYFNNYSSGIPATFGNLTSLVRLDMGRCGLTGTIPPELGNLGNLDSMFLQLNELVGVIPVQIGNLVNLVSLDLSYNNLSGIIPPALIYLQKLELLSLMSNNFEGEIPDFIGDMPNLQVISSTRQPLLAELQLLNAN